MLNQPLALMQAAIDTGDVATIAWAQVIIAAAMLMLLLLAIGGALVSYSTLRALGRLIKEMENVMDRLVPRAEPLIDGATRLTTDLAAMTQSVRGELEEVRITLADVNRKIRRAAGAAEERVERFGEVLSVVQDETEDLLMGAAATARGVHAAADVLRDREVGTRRGRRPARPRRQLDEDEDFE